MNADYTPPVVADASVRGLRTLAQGLFVDALSAIAVALTAAIAGGIEWTRTYWLALLLVVGKSVVTALVSYFARIVVPPAAVVSEAAPTTRGGDA